MTGRTLEEILCRRIRRATDERGHDVDAILWGNAAEFYKVTRRSATTDEPRPTGFWRRLFGS